ncbi:MAG: cysteine desulfurase family protein, partial [Gammaproteobacteria bacterium]
MTIYLDHHASTPIDPLVLDAMLPVLSMPGNPASAHQLGRNARGSIDQARESIAALVMQVPSSVVFCSGATEANNLAILGTRTLEKRTGVLYGATEHPSVIAPADARNGNREGRLGVEPDGRLDLDELASRITADVGLVSVQAANGEIGTLQPIARIADIVHAAGAILHVDAAQAMVGVKVDGIGQADLVTISAHKLYGPQGLGALIVAPEIRSHLKPLLLGGGQERGLRSGTVSVASVVGFGVAAQIAQADRDADCAYLSKLRDQMWSRLQPAGAELNGPSLDQRLPGNLNVRLPADAEAVMAHAPEVACSTGSACASASGEPSPVLKAIGLTTEAAEESLRLGVGRGNT